MVCNICKNEFDIIKGIKFCSYCGEKIDETIASEVEQISEVEQSIDETDNNETDNNETDNEEEDNNIETDNEEEDNNIETDTSERKHDTLEMPAITEEDIKKYNKNKFFASVGKKFKHIKVIISIITLIVIVSLSVVGYKFVIAKPVDEEQIKADLIGKVIVLPKGTSIEIKKDFIKNFSISTRKTERNKGKDDIKTAVTLNNGIVEVKTILSFMYTYEGRNQWKISDKIELTGDTVVKPVAAMDESKLLDKLKNFSITVKDITMQLNAKEVKSISLFERKPDFQTSKEVALAEVVVDDGMVSASGKIKCNLVFENEAWNITSIERNSTEDFGLVLSPSFSQDRVLQIIKDEGMEETVTSENLFGGNEFNINDSFTKSIDISEKSFDGENETLNVTVRRENTAGEINSTLISDYNFSLSFNKLALLKKSAVRLESAAVKNMDTEFIISTIGGAEIEGGKKFFLLDNNHTITEEEAKTFKVDEILSKSGLDNVKYVYGSITSTGGKKDKSINFSALYMLVYDDSKGYLWKLDRIIGEDSPYYKSKASIN